MANMRPKNTGERGSLLMYVLIVGAVLLVGVASMFSSVNMAITSDQKFYRQEDAEMAARSAIHMALAEIKAGDFEFDEPIKFEVGQAVGTITFENNGGPYSTNNLVSSSGKVGWHSQLVPAKCIHLVSVGSLGAQKVVLEMMISQTSFPWSVASNGTIQGNDMEVFALNSLEDAKTALTDELKQRSDVLSNAPGQSIELSGNSAVSGDAKAVGTVGLIGNSVVKGKTEENQQPTEIILAKRASDFRPPDGEYRLFSSGSGQTISGWYMATGDTIIGDVILEDGMIFVDGSVTVTGKISGNGALVATGNITVTGSMNTSADLAALVAGGDISITGQGTTTSSFQGLILAEGSFTAKDTTLIGSVLTLDKNGSVKLERVRTVAAKDLTKIDLNYAVALHDTVFSKTGGSGSGLSSPNKPGVMYKGEFIEWAERNYSQLEGLAADMLASKDFGEPGLLLADGTFVKQGDPRFASAGFVVLGEFSRATKNWDTYTSQLKTNSVVYNNVFQLDLNKFLKTKGGLRPLLQRVSVR